MDCSDQTWITRLGGNCLYLLSHLPGPGSQQLLRNECHGVWSGSGHHGGCPLYFRVLPVSAVPDTSHFPSPFPFYCVDADALARSPSQASWEPAVCHPPSCGDSWAPTALSTCTTSRFFAYAVITNTHTQQPLRGPRGTLHAHPSLRLSPSDMIAPRVF